MNGIVGEIPNRTGGYCIPQKISEKWTDLPASTRLPIYAEDSNLIMHNGELHLLGGFDRENAKAATWHYKYTGGKWVSVSTLPYGFNAGNSCSINGEIHIFGGNGTASYHYKWDGTTWTRLNNLGFGHNSGFLLYYKNKYYFLGGTNAPSIFVSWDGTTFTSVGSLPYNFVHGAACVYNDEIHIFGGNDSRDTVTNHYKWNGSTWTKLNDLQFDCISGYAVDFGNKLILDTTGGMRTWNSTTDTWEMVSSHVNTSKSAINTIYDNKLYYIFPLLENGNWIASMTTFEYANDLVFNLPAGARILCSNFTISDSSGNTSSDNYYITKNSGLFTITRPSDEDIPLTILLGREILYCEDKAQNVEMISGMVATTDSGSGGYDTTTAFSGHQGSLYVGKNNTLLVEY